MSGGYFNYEQYVCDNMADDIQNIVDTNDSTEKNEWNEEIGHHYPPDIIQRFKKTVKILRIAKAMVQRVDWLLSGDDNEDDFKIRWEEDVVNKYSFTTKTVSSG